MICTAKTATNAMIGVCTVDGFDGQRQLNESQNGGSGYGYVMNGNKLGDGGGSYGASWAVDDIMGIALDLDTAQNTGEHLRLCTKAGRFRYFDFAEFSHVYAKQATVCVSSVRNALRAPRKHALHKRTACAAQV